MGSLRISEGKVFFSNPDLPPDANMRKLLKKRDIDYEFLANDKALPVNLDKSLPALPSE